MQIESRKVLNALKKKGFIPKPDSGDGHKFFCYKTLSGQISSVFTFLGHSKSKYKHLGDTLINKMSDQCEFDSKKDFLAFIECSISQDQYNQMLKDKKII